MTCAEQRRHTERAGRLSALVIRGVLAPASAPVFLFSYLAALLCLGGVSAHGLLFYEFAEPPAGKKPVKRLRPFLAHLDFESGGPVFEMDAGSASVDFLTTGSGAAYKRLLEVFFIQAGGCHPFFESVFFFRCHAEFRHSGLFQI